MGRGFDQQCGGVVCKGSPWWGTMIMEVSVEGQNAASEAWGVPEMQVEAQIIGEAILYSSHLFGPKTGDTHKDPSRKKG